MTTPRRNIAAPIGRRRTVGHGGGYLSGTTAVVGIPDTPVRRRVHLYLEIDHISGSLRRGLQQWIGAQWAPGGEWRFSDLDLSRRYTVVTFDDAGTYDPVIKGGLVPSPMDA